MATIKPELLGFGVRLSQYDKTCERSFTQQFKPQLLCLQASLCQRENRSSCWKHKMNKAL